MIYTLRIHNLGYLFTTEISLMILHLFRFSLRYKGKYPQTTRFNSRCASYGKVADRGDVFYFLLAV